MLGASEFCTRDPHDEGAEVFGSHKQKPNTPIEAENETHKLDTVNFFHPRVAKRLTRACVAILSTIPEEPSPSVQYVSPLSPTGSNICRIMAIQEINVNEKLWHIS